jgi:hypothetical protein
MSVGYRPPNLQRLDLCLFFDLFRHIVVSGRGIQADIGGNQEELSGAIVHRHDPMIQTVMHTGGLPRAVAQQPLWLIGGDVDLYDRSAKLTSPKAGSASQNG